MSHKSKFFSRIDVVDLSDTLYTRPYSIVFRQPELPQDVFAVQVKLLNWYISRRNIPFLLVLLATLAGHPDHAVPPPVPHGSGAEDGGGKRIEQRPFSQQKQPVLGVLWVLKTDTPQKKLRYLILFSGIVSQQGHDEGRGGDFESKSAVTQVWKTQVEKIQLVIVTVLYTKFCCTVIYTFQLISFTGYVFGLLCFASFSAGIISVLTSSRFKNGACSCRYFWFNDST